MKRNLPIFSLSEALKFCKKLYFRLGVSDTLFPKRIKPIFHSQEALKISNQYIFIFLEAVIEIN